MYTCNPFINQQDQIHSDKICGWKDLDTMARYIRLTGIDEKGAKCLAKKYLGVDHKHEFQCEYGHKWKTNAWNILKEKSWCPVCAKKSRTMQSLDKFIKKYNFKVLTEIKDITNTREKIVIVCNKNHKITTSISAIQQRDRKKRKPCFVCEFKISGKSQGNGSIEILHLLAKNKKGKCLSKKYNKSNTKYQWQCNEGHKFSMTSNSVQSGKWCPECAKISNGLKQRQKTLEGFKKYARKHKGKCLTEIKETKAVMKVKFKCSKGHIFELGSYTFKNNSWCPTCKKK